MHLVIYGSDSDGSVTVNADGVRVRLQKKDGSWKATDEARLTEVRSSVARALGTILGLLSAGEPATTTRKRGGGDK